MAPSARTFLERRRDLVQSTFDRLRDEGKTSIERLAADANVPVGSVHRVLRSKSTNIDHVDRMAAALGIPLNNPPTGSDERDGASLPRHTFGFSLPVVAMGQAREGEEVLFDPLEEPYEVDSYEGIVEAVVRGSSLLPVAADGQRVLLKPTLHPDEAPPHKDFDEPIAMVRYRDKDGDDHTVIKRWQRLHRRKKSIVLLSVNLRFRDERGRVARIELGERQVLDAWTMVGSKWL